MTDSVALLRLASSRAFLQLAESRSPDQSEQPWGSAKSLPHGMGQ